MRGGACTVAPRLSGREGVITEVGTTVVADAVPSFSRQGPCGDPGDKHTTYEATEPPQQLAS